MEHAGLPFGYTYTPHRQKRSHAQMEGHDRSSSPSWFSNSFTPAGDLHPSVPMYRSHEQQQREPSADSEAEFYDQEDSPDSSLYPPNGRPSSASAAHPNTSGLHLPQEGDMAVREPRRYAGDGLDYRRPVSSARAENTIPAEDARAGQDGMHIDLSRDEDVIDLTADDSGYGASQDGNHENSQGNNDRRQPQQSHGDRRAQNGPPRLPRGMDIIIDLDNGEEEWRMATPSVPEPGSPEFEIISSRVLQPPRRHTPAARRGESEGDEVEFLGQQPLSHMEIQRRREREYDTVLDLLGTMNGRFTHLRAQVDRFNAQVNRTAANFRRPPIVPPRATSRNARAHVQVAFAAPMLDFDMVGFDMGMGPARPQEPPAPTYNAPEKAPEGFTRAPQEDDVLVCPNCDIELCSGDDETKRQVWVVKACGHVYCGECTTNRSVKKSSKGKERSARTKPFKECVVEDCSKRVTNAKAMIQVFL